MGTIWLSVGLESRRAPHGSPAETSKLTENHTGPKRSRTLTVFVEVFSPQLNRFKRRHPAYHLGQDTAELTCILICTSVDLLEIATSPCGVELQHATSLVWSKRRFKRGHDLTVVQESGATEIRSRRTHVMIAYLPKDGPEAKPQRPRLLVDSMRTITKINLNFVVILSPAPGQLGCSAAEHDARQEFARLLRVTYAGVIYPSIDWSGLSHLIQRVFHFILAGEKAWEDALSNFWASQQILQLMGEN
ncbi:hypothetical protein B0J17DRAFT_632202 [Rhizoctonia solani]|nr:hypothetical protein B0J17DRAFT_632202 [Rhizoctonia solani]